MFTRSNNKNSFVFICLLALLFTIGCSSPRTQFIYPEYRNNSKLDTISILFIDYDTFSEVITDHTFGQVNYEQRQFLTENSEMILSLLTQSEILGVVSDVDPKATPFEARLLEVDEIPIKIITPADETIIKHDGVIPRFVLIFDQYYFRRFSQTTEATVYAGHDRAQSRQGIFFESNYAIWDNERKNVIGWGNINADQTISGAPTFTEYFRVLEKGFEKIVQHSPFNR